MLPRRHTWGYMLMTETTTRRLLTAVALATLSACSMIPTYERPAAPVAGQWPASAGAATASATVAPLPWQDFFADASLRELVEVALRHNRDLRMAALNIEQAAAVLGARRADQLPTVNGVLGGSRAPNGVGGISSLYTAGLSVTAFEFDFFGRIASLKEQALAQYLASREAREAAQLSLAGAVAQTWLALLGDEELLALSRETLRTREESLKLVQLRADNGASSELDLRLAQSLLASARVTLAQQQRQRALDENALVLLLGQDLPATVRARLPAQRLTQLRLPELAPGLPSDVLMQRPDIRQAEQLLAASNANIGAARAAFFPRISLTAGLGSASKDLAGLFKNGSWGFTLAPQLIQPLFDAGRNQANLAAARVAFDVAIAQYEKSIQSAFREVADGLASRETLQQQAKAQQAQLDADAERLRLTDLRYRNGAASQLDWLDAQRTLFATQVAQVQVRLANLQNQVALYKALGGNVGKLN